MKSCSFMCNIGPQWDQATTDIKEVVTSGATFKKHLYQVINIWCCPVHVVISTNSTSSLSKWNAEWMSAYVIEINSCFKSTTHVICPQEHAGSVSPTCFVLNRTGSRGATASAFKKTASQRMSQYITGKQCQLLTHSTSYIFMHSKHKDAKPVRHMPSDPARALLWCDVITPHCHKWTTSLLRLPVNKFPRGASVICPHSTVLRTDMK